MPECQNVNWQVARPMFDMFDCGCQIRGPIREEAGQIVIRHDNDSDIDPAIHKIFSQMHDVNRKHIATTGYLNLHACGSAL